MEIRDVQESHTKYYHQWYFTTDKDRVGIISSWQGNILVMVKERVQGHDMALKVFERVADSGENPVQLNQIIDVLKNVDLETEIEAILKPSQNTLDQQQ